MAWILTDDSSTQYVRRLEGGNVYQLIEISMINPETNEFEVYEDTINVDDYIEKYKDELLQVLNGFGYISVENVIHAYGNYEAYQVIAECVFEYYGSFQALQVFVGTEDECISFIKGYVNNTNVVWYRADYDNNTESEYSIAKTDDKAIEIAKGMRTVDYADIGEVRRRLVQLFEVDDNMECFKEIRMVWG